MKKILLVAMMLLIYLLSSVSHVPILEPSLWHTMKFTSFSIPLNELFSLNSSFYEPYQLSLDWTLLAHKGSHFLFFGVLSLLFLWNLAKRRKAYFYAWSCTTLYGLIDELHQMATPTRTGCLQDVWIDSFSALIWLFSFRLLLHVGKKTIASSKIKPRKPINLEHF